MLPKDILVDLEKGNNTDMYAEKMATTAINRGRFKSKQQENSIFQNDDVFLKMRQELWKDKQTLGLAVELDLE